jgi:enamine deaminase RidA (YjgF/YER057c/UK114 family)
MEKGLTEKTRYAASTGIEGKMWKTASLVSMDALSFSNLEEGQVVRMEALENLSPTIKYGVTFERGLKVLFGDRTRFYISGTASINSEGELLYPGDVGRQTERTLENIQALLTPHGASFTDMAYLIVYLRDPKDESLVLEIFRRYVPRGLPCLVVQAPVCRPGWLVEIDGLGVKPAQCDFPVFL